MKRFLGLFWALLFIGSASLGAGYSTQPLPGPGLSAPLYPTVSTCAPGHSLNADGSCTAGFTAVFDGEITASGNTFQLAHDTPVGAGTATTSNQIQVQSNHYSTMGSVARAFLTFDTNNLPDSAVVTGAALSLYVLGVYSNLSDGFDSLRVVDTAPASATLLNVNDYSRTGPFIALPGTDAAAPANISTLTTGRHVFPFTPFGKNLIQKKGMTTFGLLENHDAQRLTPAGSLYGTSGITFIASENPTNRPTLTVTYLTPPGARLPPPVLTASQGSFTDRVELSWTPISGAANYLIYSNPTCAGTPVQTLSAPQTQTSFMMSPNTLYYFSVKANGGECSAPEPGFQLGAPAGLIASQGEPTQIVLNWNLVGNAGQYHLYRGINGTVNPATPYASVNVPTYTDSSVPAGVPIHYAIKAQNGSAITPLGNESIGYALAPPFGVAASENQVNQVQLTWTPPSGGNGYQIYKNTVSTACTPPVYQTIGAGSSITLPAVPNTVEYYSMKALSPAGASANCSNIDAGMALDANTMPQPPTNVRASDDYYSNKIQVRWDPVPGANGYQVYRSTLNDSSTATLLGSPSTNLRNDASAGEGITYYYWVKTIANGVPSVFSTGDAGRRAWGINSLLAGDGTQSANIQLNWTNSNTATINSHYRSTLNEGCAPATLQSVLNPGPNSPLSTNPGAGQGIVPGVQYYFSVGAQQQTGGLEHCSKPEPGYAGTLSGGALSPISPPGASDGTYADKVQVYWTASPGADNYIVYRNTNNTFAGASVLAPGFTGTTYNDFTALANVDYYYWIAAHRNNPATDSPVSFPAMGFRV